MDMLVCTWSAVPVHNSVVFQQPTTVQILKRVAKVLLFQYSNYTKAD
jgi:hypothetical protein